MGEQRSQTDQTSPKQARAAAEQAGIDALQPWFTALGDLGAAAAAARGVDAIRAAAQRKAAQILENAEKEVDRRHEEWRAAWAAAAKAAGSPSMMRVGPIIRLRPPRSPKKSTQAGAASRSTRGRRTGAGERSPGASGTAAGAASGVPAGPSAASSAVRSANPDAVGGTAVSPPP